MSGDFRCDELGPEVVLQVYDPPTGVRGILVVDNTVLGPAGGGARLAPDITVQEICRLARAMTYKYGILGFPRGGCKSGIWGDPQMPPERRTQTMEAFGRAVAPYLQSRLAAIGPDMGVTVDDLETIYDGAGATRLRSGLFATLVDGDPAAYHFTGQGVIGAVVAIAAHLPFSLARASVAIEGFGQVGVGCARRAVLEGAKVVAVTTLRGGVYDPDGLDIPALLRMRREMGDECVVRYPRGKQIAREDVYYLPVDILVPGARPDVIRPDNVDRIQAKVITSGGNITVTDETHEILFRRGVISIPDFISNAGAAVATWVDFLAGTPDMALRAIDHLIGRITREVIDESIKTKVNPLLVARRRVEDRISASRGQPRLSFDATKEHIRKLLGALDA